MRYKNNINLININYMQKMYSGTSRKERVNENLVPKEDTIRFLLDYSKALSVIDYNKLKFEALLN